MAVLRVGWQPQPDGITGEPGLRVDIVELGGGDQRVDRSSAPAAFVGAGEGPVLSPQGNGPQLAFGGVVRHAKTPILEEAGDGVPPVEAVVDRFGETGIAPRRIALVFRSHQRIPKSA